MKKALVFLSALLLGATPFSYVSAQSAEFQSAAQKVNESVEKLLTDGDVATDFSLRKAALLKVYELTIVELHEVYERIATIDKRNEKELLDVQVSLISALTQLNEQVAQFKSQADGALYADEVKRFAYDFKGWRMAQFDPIIAKSLDLSLVLRSRSVLTLVEGRLEKVATDVTKLEQIFKSAASPLQTELTLARATVAHARSLYEDARDAFFAKYEGKQSPDIKVVTLEIISSVKKTYQLFFNMSAVAEKLLETK